MNSKETKKGRAHFPNPARLIQALSQIGYRFEDAIADLIDNSITAGASEIMIRFFHDGEQLVSIAIADNGIGMSEKKLINSMVFGSDEDLSEGTLGKFGLGLKLASLSRCTDLSVHTKKNGKISGQKWSEQNIAAGWLLEPIEKTKSVSLFKLPWADLNLSKHGTIIQWEGLRNLPTHKKGIRSALGWVERKLRIHLGLTFHRFIEKGKVRIRMDQQHVEEIIRSHSVTIKPLNPFGYEVSGHKEFPMTLKTSRIPSIGRLNLECHIWPPLSEDECYRLGKQASSHQGFYVYRNDRLIQAGGWFGLVGDETEPHRSLARIKLDLPKSADAFFELNVQKSSVNTPLEFASAVESSISSSGAGWEFFKTTADSVYRGSSTARSKFFTEGIGVPGGNYKSRSNPNALNFKFKKSDIPISVDLSKSEVCISSELSEIFKNDPLKSSRYIKRLLFEVLRKENSGKKLKSNTKEIIDNFNTYLSNDL